MSPVGYGVCNECGRYSMLFDAIGMEHSNCYNCTDALEHKLHVIAHDVPAGE